MPAITATQSSPRVGGQRRITPTSTGTPDPRPLTDYTVALTVVGAKSRLTVTLSQPCVIRTPNWAVVDMVAGARTYPTSVTVVNNTTFFFDYPAVLLTSIALVEAPYQDMQVQNFQGGFVRPGGQWFRAPVMPG